MMLNHQIIRIMIDRKKCDNDSNMPCPTSINYVMECERDRLVMASPVKKRICTSTNEPQKKKLKLGIFDDDERKLHVTDGIENNANDSDPNAQNPSPDGNKNSTDSDSTKSIGILHYSDKDVLSGRGGGTNLHSGNRYYRELILSQCPAYEDASKMMKPEISRQIVVNIHKRGGRFLRKSKTDGIYYEIEECKAREKTSQALRHRSFELRNVLDPKRAKMNGRCQKSKEIKGNISKTDNEKKMPPAITSVLEAAVSKRGSSSSNHPPPDYFSEILAGGLGNNFKVKNSNVMQQSLDGGSHTHNSSPNINYTSSAYQQYTEGMISSRRRNETFLEERLRQQLYSSTQYFDLLRFSRRSSSFGLYSNSIAHGYMLRNSAMTSMNNYLPIFQQERNMNIQPPFPINNNDATIRNSTGEGSFHLSSVRMQDPCLPSFPFSGRGYSS